MPDDLRDRYAEAIAMWALMYPISSWALAEGDGAERLAGHWGRVAAKFVEDVRDSEMERLRDYGKRMEEMVIEKDSEAGSWQDYLHKAEGDLLAANAAIARVRELADRWGITDPGAKAEILAALDGETPGVKPYYEADGVALYLGDSREVLRGMADASVDAVVTDPPYNLSVSSKRDVKCLRRIVAEFALPYDEEGDVQLGKGGDLTRPPVSAPDLRGIDRAIGVFAGVGVPEGAVHLQGAPVSEEEVDGGDEAPAGTSNVGLPLVGDTESVKTGGGYVLQLADFGNAPFCDGTCSCFTEPSAGVITVTVALTGSTARDLAGTDFGGWWRGNQDVRLGDDALSQAEGSPL